MWSFSFFFFFCGLVFWFMQLSKSNVCTITSFLKIQQWNIAYNLTQACIYEHEKWQKYTEEEHVSSNVQECREWLMRTQRLGSDTWSQDFVFESQMIMSHEENDYMSFTNNPLLKIITMVEDFIHFIMAITIRRRKDWSCPRGCKPTPWPRKTEVA